MTVVNQSREMSKGKYDLWDSDDDTAHSTESKPIFDPPLPTRTKDPKVLLTDSEDDKLYSFKAFKSEVTESINKADTNPQLYSNVKDRGGERILVEGSENLDDYDHEQLKHLYMNERTRRWVRIRKKGIPRATF